MKKMLQELDFHLPVIRSFAFKVLQRQRKILLRNSLFLKAKHAEDLALLLCGTLLKANVGNQRLFPGLVVLFSPSTLRCLLSFSFFLSFFFSLIFPLICKPSCWLHLDSSYKWIFSLLPVYFLQGIIIFFFFLALPKGLIWKYHILTGKNTLLDDLFTMTGFFFKQSSREKIFVFQRGKRMSCSVAMKDNELSLSLTVKPLEKYNRPWETGLDIDVLAILACVVTWWLPCLYIKNSLYEIGASAEGRGKEYLWVLVTSANEHRWAGLVGTRKH